MKSQKLLLSLFFAVIISATGISSCSIHRAYDFTIASTKQYDVGAKYVKIGKAEGVDATWWIFVFPTGIPLTVNAINNCISNGGGDIATNIVVYQQITSFFLATRFSYIAKADVWKRASMGDLQNPDANIFELQKNDIGKFELQSTKYSSERYTVVDPSSPDVMNDVKVVQQ
jgi:hypothetical protein